MLDIGWPELMIILVIAVIVIGPKDLPKTMYTVGKWVKAARRMTGQMQRQFDDAMREAELDEIKDGLKKASPGSIKKQIEKTIDPTGTLGKAVDIGSGRSVKQYLKEGLTDGGKPGDKEAKKSPAAEAKSNVADAKPAKPVEDEGADKVDIAGVQDPVPSGTGTTPVEGENVTPKIDKPTAPPKQTERVAASNSERPS